MYDFLPENTFSPQILLLIGLGGGILLLIWFATAKSGGGSLNIKSKTVGDGQHGTARCQKKFRRPIHGCCSKYLNGGKVRNCPRHRG